MTALLNKKGVRQMDIGRNIKDLRKKNNITQDALAEYLHISPQAV